MGIRNAAQLKQSIALLKIEQEEKKSAMVGQFRQTYESFKPINLIKSAYHRVAETPDIANKLIGTSLGLGAGIISKRILFGRSPGFIKRMLGMALELTLANKVAKNSDGIRQKGAELIRKLIK
ncbi:MAG TPA: hypothetical protein VK489_00135 [Ferruginibacter sp.]|nr:hypothetical protein [Ferruginibacter sp.]